MRSVALFMTIILLFGAVLPGQVCSQEDELVLRVAMQDDIRTTNPLNAGSVWSWNVLKWLYEGPVRTDPETNDIIPYILVGSANQSTDLSIVDWDDCFIGTFGYNPKDSWADQNKSETTIFYDFTGVTWHDGVQMTVRDVLFSFHVAAQMPDWSASVYPLKDRGGRPGSNYPNDHKLFIEQVWSAEDELQVALKFTLQQPYADFFRETLGIFLLPYHIWGSRAGGQSTDNTKIWCDLDYNKDAADAWRAAAAQEWDNPSPVGSGPFEWDNWEPAMGTSRITTFRDHFYEEGFNPEYDPDGLAAQPNIDAMVFKVYRTAEHAVLALRNDDVDYIGWSIPPTFIGELAYYPGITFQQTLDTGFYYLGYNMRKASFGYNETGYDSGKPLRRAIAHCIDKNRIVQRLLLNFGIRGEGPISSVSRLFNESIPKYDFDPDKAIAILADAGYLLTDGPGSTPGPGNWWLNPNGSQIGDGERGLIEILTPQVDYDPIRAEAGRMIAQQMREIGVNVKSTPMDFGMIVAMLGASRNPGDFEMYILGWKISSEPIDYLYEFFHSSNALMGDNFVGYQNSSFDDIIDQARMTGDYEERQRLIFEAQAAIAYDLPYDVLYYRVLIEAYRSENFVGWKIGTSGSIFNWRSIMEIRQPSGYRLNAKFVNLPQSVISNSSISINVLVTDQDRIPVEGAMVWLNASGGLLENEFVNTTSSGMARTTFTALYVPPIGDNINNGTAVNITIRKATSSEGEIEYNPAPSRLGLITVYPEETPSLFLSISANPDVIDPDIDSAGVLGFTYVNLEVEYQDGFPASDVTVKIEATPDNLFVTPDSSTTDVDGKASFTLSAGNLTHNDGSTVEYTIIGRAFHPTDYTIKKGTSNVYVYVVDAEESPSPPGTYPVIETVSVIVAIFAVALVISIVSRSRLKR